MEFTPENRKNVNEEAIVAIEEDGSDITFSINGKGMPIEAYLQCQVNQASKIFTARFVKVQKNLQRQGLGLKLFKEAIGYARLHDLKFVTDHGLSLTADKLIQKLITEGFHFIKNEKAQEREGANGTRIVTFDGSPVYTLED